MSGGFRRKLLTRLVVLLACVSGEGDRLGTLGVAKGEIFLQLLKLGVAEGIHRIDHNGSDTGRLPGGAAMQHVVHDGDKVTQALA